MYGQEIQDKINLGTAGLQDRRVVMMLAVNDNPVEVSSSNGLGKFCHVTCFHSKSRKRLLCATEVNIIACGIIFFIYLLF